MNLINSDCLVELKNLPDKSINFFYLDLPYGQTAMRWDKKIDLKLLWVQLKRLAKNERTPFFFSCTTKFGYDLIKSNEKYFRWDLVWEKNRASGFLNCYKLPMRKHELIYCFAKKSPEYDVSSHKDIKKTIYKTLQPPIDMYGSERTVHKTTHKERLPTSVLSPEEDHELIYCFAKKCPEYDVSSHKEVKIPEKKHIHEGKIYGNKETWNGKTHKERLPTSVLTEQSIPSSWIKCDVDTKTNHRTSKPVTLMEFLLKYWTKEGDVICDPTMGGGAMGVACKNMNRKFIGIEKDEDIFNIAFERINNII